MYILTSCRQCLLDESSSIITNLSCPSCSNPIAAPSSSTSAPKILTRYHNEGGLQENLDIAPLVTEEAYLTSNPAARPARAFITMCAEGDISGIVELLQAISDDAEEGDLSPSDIVRFRDPLEEGKTGLHVAMEKDKEEVVWLLLWLASRLETSVFPPEVLSIAETLGAGRDTADGEDIRGIKNADGRTPGDVARAAGGGVWSGLLGAGIV